MHFSEMYFPQELIKFFFFHKNHVNNLNFAHTKNRNQILHLGASYLETIVFNQVIISNRQHPP
jgi:hypothetical protein